MDAGRIVSGDEIPGGFGGVVEVDAHELHVLGILGDYLLEPGEIPDADRDIAGVVVDHYDLALGLADVVALAGERRALQLQVAANQIEATLGALGLFSEVVLGEVS